MAGDIAFLPILMLGGLDTSSQVSGLVHLGIGLIGYVKIERRSPRHRPPDRIAAFNLRFGMALGICIASAWAPLALISEHSRNTVALIATAVAVLSLLAWINARPTVNGTRAVLNDDPAFWPDLPAIRHHREVAFSATTSRTG